MLLYDGDCEFCTSTATWMRRHIPSSADVQPYQRADLTALGVTAEQCAEAVQWIGSDGVALGGHRAIAQALIAGGGPWRALGHLFLLPGLSRLAASTYTFVASHRSCLVGGHGRRDHPSDQGTKPPLEP